MPLWMLLVVGWLVASPLVALGTGLVIRRAGELAAEAELPSDAVPDRVPARMVVQAASERAAGSLPRPSRALDDVMHLRLTSPEA